MDGHPACAATACRGLGGPTFPRVVPGALLLLGACVGYVPSARAPAPGPEVVRLPLAPSQVLVVERRADAADGGVRAAGGAADTLRGLTAAYGRVLSVRGDTLTLALTQVSRAGELTPMPPGREAVVVRDPARPLEYGGYSDRRTTGLLVTVGVLVVVAGAFFATILEGVAD